ncbi:hypothetical protein P170DRAFT_475456 [Aspergillus steynii IBT 23096]|uniref:Uncharacterized protein n=1 Tax=Aspergillus steynii IBT 23096 TaxID=1392250 RepID=A0A2I2G8C6_9EURO|nr:uncharacterized protein P170DRAFT_475456 [Aspergillus steynii IBT 23096]PLB49139.1 hypothetical protein P170DRAFT_475456 [Aspergillus steynii IBT 23096]
MNVRLFLPLLGLLLGARSQECTPPDGQIYFNITGQDSIDALSSSCTTLVGPVSVASNFSGEFVLPKITNMTNEFSVTSKFSPNVAVIDLPDLEYMGSTFRLGSVAETLERISVPKVESLQSLSLYQYRDNATVDFRSLRTLKDLYIQGNYSRVRLDSLRNVTSLTICNTKECDFLGTQTARRGMKVSLPNLETVDILQVTGGIAKLAVPKISSGVIRVESDKTPADFDFAQVTSVPDGSSLNIQGHITRLSLPRLESILGNFDVKTSHPLEVNLPVLTESQGLYLNGSIKSVSLPALEVPPRIRVHSDLDLNCGKLRDEVIDKTGEPAQEWDILCKSTYKPWLNTKRKVIIGVVVGVGGLAVLVAAWFFWKKRASKRKKIDGMVDELTTWRQSQDNPPPPYTRNT